MLHMCLYVISDLYVTHVVTHLLHMASLVSSQQGVIPIDMSGLSQQHQHHALCKWHVLCTLSKVHALHEWRGFLYSAR